LIFPDKISGKNGLCWDNSTLWVTHKVPSTPTTEGIPKFIDSPHSFGMFSTLSQKDVKDTVFANKKKLNKRGKK
jgi:hypothetical protein